MSVDTGLQPIGRVEWGTHFCHFYRDQAEVADTLVPYFKTGLETNDACLWVTAEPFSKEAALAHLRVYFDDLDARIGRGQLTVLDHAEWYERAGRASVSAVANMWLDAKNKALDRGYAGLRLTGNTGFLRTQDWDDFNGYETAVHDVFGGQQFLALCSYQADRWDSNATLDVVQTHDFALARRRGSWEVIESAAARRSRAALARQQLLAAELSHRVKNAIASVQSLVNQSLRSARSPAEAMETVSGRLTALAQAHEQLAMGEWTSSSLLEIVKAVVSVFGTRVRIDIGNETLTARAALDLSLVLHELMTNAVKYGALRSERGTVTIQSSRPSANEPCTLVWFERGGPAAQPPARKGFGTALAEQLIRHDLRGECEFAFEPAGLRCTIVIPTEQLLAHGGQCMHGCGH
jgi:two-component sensor histidine kinase